MVCCCGSQDGERGSQWKVRHRYDYRKVGLGDNVQRSSAGSVLPEQTRSADLRKESVIGCQNKVNDEMHSALAGAEG